MRSSSFAGALLSALPVAPASASFVADPLPTAADLAAEPFIPLGECSGRGAAGEAETAEPSVEERIAEARQEGFDAGRAELPWREAEALRQATGALEEAARGVAELRVAYLREQRHALVEIALAVAEKLVRREIAVRPDALAALVEQCLDALPEEVAAAESNTAELRLAPAQLEVLERGLAPELARLCSEHGLRVEADPSLQAADVRVLSAKHRIDARLPELLRRVREALAQALDVEEGAP